MIRLAVLCFVVGSIASFGQITVDLRGADGAVHPYTLKGHPRVWLDGPDGPITRALRDPDGPGPQRSAKASGPLWTALRKRLDIQKPKAATDLSGVTVMLSALAWFMDNNGKFSDGTPYRTVAIDQIRNVQDIWVGLGGCDRAANFCGTTAIYPGTHASYMGSLVSFWVLGYTLIRSELTPQERADFSEKILNGITKDIGGNCENRYERLPGTLQLSLSGTKYTASGTDGTHWDSTLKGQWIYVKRPSAPTGAGIFIRLADVSTETEAMIDKPGTAQFLNIPLHAYRIKPWASGQCGMGYVADNHPNIPTYTVGYGQSKMTRAISEADTTLSVDNTSWLPSYVPFYVRLGPSNAFELVKVTAVEGKSMTISRGEFSTVAKSWGTNSPVLYQSHTGPGDPMGWNNRTLTRQVGHIMAAIALADDDPRALDLLKATVDYWYTNTWFAANNYFTIINTAATSYGLSREMPFLLWSVQSFFSSFSPPLDYRGEWIQWAGSDFFFYWTLPWNKNGLINFGIAADNCQGLGGGAELQCSGALAFLQGLYPGTPSAQRAWGWLDKQGVLNESTRLVTQSGERILLPLILYTDSSLPKSDYRLELPTHFVGNRTGDTSGQGKNFSAFSSRTDWSDNATLFYSLVPDNLTKEYPKISLSEKVQDDLLGDYGIGKNGWFLGQVNDGYWTRYLGQENAVDFGPVTYDTITPFADLELDRQLSDEKSQYLYVRADVKKGYSSVHKVTRGYRYFVHFKAAGATEHIVVYDDFATDRPQRVRDMLHYLNNGQAKMGQTYFSEDAALVTSDNTKAKLFTRLVKISGAATVTDLNVAWKGNVATVGSYCSASDPCRAKIGGTVYSYTAPATLTITPAATDISEVYVWLDASGKIYGASNKAGLACDGTLDCSGTAAAFPDGVIPLARMVYKNAKATSACPGPTAVKLGAEYHNCIGGDQRHIFMDSGLNGTTGEFLVVHQPTELGGSPDPAGEIQEIDHNFTGVQIKGSNPKVAVFGRGGTGYSSTTFVTDHEGTGRYLIAGLAPGKYDVQRGGQSVFSGLEVTTQSEALSFESTSGSFSVFRTGDPQPLKVAEGSLPPASLGNPYGTSLTAEGGAPPYVWSIQSGNLPDGVTLSTTSGLISGTALLEGNFTFTLQVTDSAGATVALPLNLAVQAPSTDLSFAVESLQPAVSQSPYSFTVAVQGGTEPYSWEISAGELPEGLTLNGDTGEISGTATGPASVSITITVTDSAGVSVSRDFVFEVNNPSA